MWFLGSIENHGKKWQKSRKTLAKNHENRSTNSHNETCRFISTCVYTEQGLGLTSSIEKPSQHEVQLLVGEILALRRIDECV